MFADAQILKSAFVFYCQVAELLQNSAPEQTGRSTNCWTFLRTGIKLHICESAGWRSIFQNEPVYFSQSVEEPGRKSPYAFRKIQARRWLNEFQLVPGANDAQGRTWNPQADFDLGANGDDLYVWLKACNKLILYDPSVVSAGIKADAFADDNCGFREVGQRPFPIARTIPRSIPAKINWWIGYKKYQ
jgi:hypothetical protein